jgi:hypothetical protein
VQQYLEIEAAGRFWEGEERRQKIDREHMLDNVPGMRVSRGGSGGKEISWGWIRYWIVGLGLVLLAVGWWVFLIRWFVTSRREDQSRAEAEALKQQAQLAKALREEQNWSTRGRNPGYL